MGVMGDDRWHAARARMMIVDALMAGSAKPQPDYIVNDIIARAQSLADEAVALFSAVDANRN